MRVVKIIALLIVLLSLSTIVKAQPSKGSVSLGYGTHKFVARGDLKITDKLIKVENSSTRLYFDIGYDWKKFQNESFTFSSVEYNSKVWMLAIGVGIGQEFIIKDIFVVQPYLGLYYKYARFRDKDLVEGIGENNLIRYQYLPDGTKIQVGKVVENGYGNLVTVDFGSRVGFRIKKKFEIGGSVGVCPSNFSTNNTLFGKYWGEKPYLNDYYIKRFILKGEFNLKYNF